VYWLLGWAAVGVSFWIYDIFNSSMTRKAVRAYMRVYLPLACLGGPLWWGYWGVDQYCKRKFGYRRKR